MREARAERLARAADTEASRRAWPDGFQAALSISFDDARRSQIDLGLPVIDQLGIPATFFVLPHGVDLARRGWQELVAAGHEIGNHTARHPCSAQLLLEPPPRHRGPQPRRHGQARSPTPTPGWPRCSASSPAASPTRAATPSSVGARDTQSYVPLVAERFVAGRTFNDVAINSPVHGDLAQISAMNSDGLTFEQLRPTLEATLDDGAWLVLGGHEIGHRGDAETTMPATLAATVEWCRSHDVWIDSIGNVASRVRTLQRGQQASRLAQ